MSQDLHTICIQVVFSLIQFICNCSSKLEIPFINKINKKTLKTAGMGRTILTTLPFWVTNKNKILCWTLCNIFSLICTYQGLRIVSFSENFIYVLNELSLKVIDIHTVSKSKKKRWSTITENIATHNVLEYLKIIRQTSSMIHLSYKKLFFSSNFREILNSYIFFFKWNEKICEKKIKFGFSIPNKNLAITMN